MAEFVQTMKDWRRMCKDRSCGSCNLRGSCNIDPDSRTDADIQKIDTKVKIWAAEHPEPVYPTWFEYLYAINDPDYFDLTEFYTWMRHTPIPADIAEKLGVQPKEGACTD